MNEKSYDIEIERTNFVGSGKSGSVDKMDRWIQAAILMTPTRKMELEEQVAYISEQTQVPKELLRKALEWYKYDWHNWSNPELDAWVNS